MDNLSKKQAVRLLKGRAAAVDDLLAYSEIIDIPAVPIDASEDVWEIVATPLADHHRLTLHALQAMVDGRLLYRPDTLEPVTRPTPQGLVIHSLSTGLHTGLSTGLSTGKSPCPADETPHGGRSDTGGGGKKDSAPSPNPTNSAFPHPPAPTRIEGNQRVSDLEDQESAVIHGEIPQFYLEGVRYGVCRRVMIMMPPGSAKSTYASVVFPTWQMGRRPDTEIILTGWGDPICKRHGKRARKICSDPLYRGIMDTGIDPNTRAAEDWACLNGSTYKSSGINSGIAGFRCDGLVWDDLTKNRKEADSETVRNDTYNAYIDDARSRKKPDAWEVGIGTRWHEEEIMGRILPEGYSGESGYMLCRDGNVWLIICLAAECERNDDPLGREIGEMIWPEWFGEDYWAEKRVNPRSWGSLYQQRPAPEEGIFFKREWFKRYSMDDLPSGDTFISFDPAVTDESDNQHADATAISSWRTDEFARIYLVDSWMQKVTMDKWIVQLLTMGAIYKPMEMISESGIIRRAAEPFLKHAMIKARKFFKFTWCTRHANKAAMGRAAQGIVSSGQLFVPYGQVGDDFIDECLRFPASKEDHRVDTLINLCLRLEAIWEKNPPKTEEKKPSIINGGGIPIKSLMPDRFPKRKSRWKRTYKMPSRIQ
jgi:hypothetical protein